MFCKQCGNEVLANAAICVKCGVATGFVQQLGNTTIPLTHSNIPSKGKTAFVLLGVFLGAFGIHNFYAGYTGKGVAQLLITLLSLGFLGFISWIWAIIEVCTISVDARNTPFV